MLQSLSHYSGKLDSILEFAYQVVTCGYYPATFNQKRYFSGIPVRVNPVLQRFVDVCFAADVWEGVAAVAWGFGIGLEYLYGFLSEHPVFGLFIRPFTGNPREFPEAPHNTYPVTDREPLLSSGQCSGKQQATCL